MVKHRTICWFLAVCAALGLITAAAGSCSAQAVVLSRSGDPYRGRS